MMLKKMQKIEVVVVVELKLTIVVVILRVSLCRYYWGVLLVVLLTIVPLPNSKILLFMIGSTPSTSEPRSLCRLPSLPCRPCMRDEDEGEDDTQR